MLSEVFPRGKVNGDLIHFSSWIDLGCFVWHVEVRVGQDAHVTWLILRVEITVNVETVFHNIKIL